MATASGKPKGKEKEEEEEEDPFEDWTPDQPIPDEEGEAAAKRKAILDQRSDYLREQSKKKKKKKTGLW
jgi:hypothetical protein